MPDPWQARIDRAAELASRDGAASGMLQTYAQLLVFQRDVDRVLCEQAAAITGKFERDLAILRPCAIATVAAIRAHDHIPMDDESTRCESDGDAGVDAMLADGWHAPDPSFFPRLVLQPYAECLARLKWDPLESTCRHASLSIL